MSFEEPISGFHGGPESAVSHMQRGNIDVSLGGGEFGRGFYMSDRLHVAKAWAVNKHSSDSVLEARMREGEFWKLDINPLDYRQACELRRKLRRQSTTRTHRVGCDLVWGRIVGGANIYSDQYKAESEDAQSFLNGNSVVRLIW